MEPEETIDWNNIDSVFVVDDNYEDLGAPQWVDFSAPDDPPIDVDSWFCKPDCRHPKTAEDYLKSTRNLKVKFLRSVSISEVLPFRDRSRRDGRLRKPEIPNPQTLKAKVSNSKAAHNFREDTENRNPNTPSSPLVDKNMLKETVSISSAEERQELHESHARSSTKARLRSTFSARNLVGGREILNQITEFCSELKKLARKGSKKGSTDKDFGGVSCETRERVREKDKMPLLEVKEKRRGL